MTRAYPCYGGLMEPDFESAPDKAALAQACTKGRALAIFDEGTFAVVPNIRELCDPECEIALYVNSWSVPEKQPEPGQFVYSPLRKAMFEFCEENDGWLRYADGNYVYGSPGWRIMDLTLPSVRQYMAYQIREAQTSTDCKLVMFDEAHSQLGFLPNVGQIVSGRGADLTKAARNQTWESSMWDLLRKSSAFSIPHAIINGTLPITPMCAGRFQERTLAGTADDIWRRFCTLADEADETRQWCVLEQPIFTYNADLLSAIASLLGAIAQPRNMPHDDWSTGHLLLETIPPGTFGTIAGPLEWPADPASRKVAREFERGRLSVDFGTLAVDWQAK